jgi:hypothetical protein
MKATLWFNVKHPVIYLPGICTVDKTGKEYQYTQVSIHRLFIFLKTYNLKWKDVNIKPMCKLFIFFDYLFLRFDENNRIGISAAWHIAGYFTPDKRETNESA